MEDADQAAKDFIERMGLMTEADGLPRIAGRIMGFLVIHGGPFSFAELADRLKVSRSSVSVNTRLLEDLGAIERVAHSGDRQDYFALRPNAYARILGRYVQRMEHAREMVENTIDRLPQDWTGAQARLADLLAFYEANIARTRDMISLISRPAKKEL